MAGRVVVSTLNNDTGVLGTQNGMTGIAKAWVRYNQATSTINGSFNVTSITNNGTGDFTINFTTAMPDANYAWAGSCGYGSTGNQTNWLSLPPQVAVASCVTTTFLRVKNSYGNVSTNTNLEYNSVIVLAS